MEDFSQVTFDTTVKFVDLEARFGSDNARTILQTLEKMEGVYEELVADLSMEARLENVFRIISDSASYQTRH
ncbi:MAG: hypothetical protein PHX43_01685 [Alphaproteobacteria bacterium]|nr:hypothetical protein [Alphaproteobacteria bacterium]